MGAAGSSVLNAELAVVMGLLKLKGHSGPVTCVDAWERPPEVQLKLGRRPPIAVGEQAVHPAPQPLVGLFGAPQEHHRLAGEAPGFGLVAAIVGVGQVEDEAGEVVFRGVVAVGGGDLAGVVAVVAEEIRLHVAAGAVQQVQALCREQGSALIWISHDLALVSSLADEICVMYAGRIVEQASVFDLFANPRHAYTQGLLESIPRLDSKPKTLLKAIPGNVPGIADFKSGCRFAERSGREHSQAHLTTRPAFIEIAPNHFVENCPVCVS
jgi:oligopeptide/dipeptide ABC transporter ATP-binding protein